MVTVGFQLPIVTRTSVPTFMSYDYCHVVVVLTFRCRKTATRIARRRWKRFNATGRVTKERFLFSVSGRSRPTHERRPRDDPFRTERPLSAARASHFRRRHVSRRRFAGTVVVAGVENTVAVVASTARRRRRPFRQRILLDRRDRTQG